MVVPDYDYENAADNDGFCPDIDIDEEDDGGPSPDMFSALTPSVARLTTVIRPRVPRTIFLAGI